LAARLILGGTKFHVWVGLPLRSRYDPSEAIADVESFGFTAQEQRMIFHENAAALLGLD